MNPHGTCSTCCWHTHDFSKDYDGDVWHRWRCWRGSGEPECRMATTTDREPPACEHHFAEKEGAA